MQPAAGLRRRRLQTHAAGQQGLHAQPGEFARVRRQGHEVGDAQVVAVLLVAGDALVVVDEVPAAVQDQPVPVDLDGARVVRGVAVDDIGAAVHQGVGEAALFAGTG